jgi:hypothetical protein
MKKFLPILILLLGIGVLVGVFLFIKGRGSEEDGTDEEVAEVAFEKRPVTSLTPSADGHWLKLEIEKFSGLGETLDYELLYQLPDGRTQGVPGTITLGSETKIERDLLLGSESSGKFRYDEGVKEGTLTLRFRNSKGKLTAKFLTEFSLVSETDSLASIDGKFKYQLEEVSDDFFVVMATFGVPKGFSTEPSTGPYGVFSSSESLLPGSVTLSGGKIEAYLGGKWTSLEANKSSSLGIFMATP